MDTKGILQIIRACAQHGVREFAQGDLKLSFFPKSEEVVPVPGVTVPIQTRISTKLPTPVAVPPIVEKRMNEVSEAEDRKAAIKEIDEEVDELLLTDPLAYEEMLARGDLVDDPQLQH